jgi:fucose permease
VGLAQIALALAFLATVRAWPAREGPERVASSEAPASIRATLRLPAAQWSILLFFAYTGLELAIGAWTFTLLTEGRGLSMAMAGSSISLYWLGLTVGRVLGAMLGRRSSAESLVRGCLIALTGALALLAAGLSPHADLAALVLAGVAAGPVFPTLIATTPARVGGQHAANAVGFQIAAAAVGQSLLPSVLGVIADRLGLEALAAGLIVLGVFVVSLCVSMSRRVRGGAHEPARSHASRPRTTLPCTSVKR